MQRRPEPELMDEAAQAQAYALADFEDAHQGFIDFYDNQFGTPADGARVLDLGCGSADITIRFARRYPMTRLVGVDGAEAMLRFGRRFVTQQGLGSRIELRRQRLQEMGPPEHGYDILISNSLLHHLHDPQLLWQSVEHNAKSGATICIMDLSRPADPETVAHLVRTYAHDAPEVLRRDFSNSLCAAFTPQEVRQQLNDCGLGNLEVQTISDRHLVVFGTIR